MTMSAIQSHNLDLALQLAAQGVFVFPCVGQGDRAKCPCPGIAWRSASTTDPKRIQAWWRRWPDAVAAIDVGRSGMLAVDCDTKRSDGHAWLIALLGEELLAGVPGGDTPSGGRHYLFRNPDGLGNSRGGLPPKTEADIDIRGDGGYIIAPGARFTDGSGNYVARGVLADVPDMPAALVDLLTKAPPSPQGAAAPPPQAARVASGGVGPSVSPAAVYVPGRPISDAQREAYGRNALDGAAAELAAAQVGERNELANVKAFHIGRLVGGGYLTQGEAYSALERAGLSLGLPPRDKLFGTRGTLWRAIQAGMELPYDPLAGREEPGVVIDLATRGAYVEPPPEPPPPPTPPTVVDLLPGDWSQPRGLLGEITDYIMATSRRPNRPLAIAAATAVLSTLCGRHLYGPTGTSLNLYIVMLAGTGVGKDRPLSVVHALLKAAGHPRLAQTAKAFSVSALEQMLIEHPCCLAVADEIGPALLNRMFHRHAKTHETSMRHVILELWGRSQGREPFATTRRAKTPGVPAAIQATVEVASPNLDLLGASTLEAFYTVLTGGSIRDGFLNRFLLAHGGPRGPTQEVPAEALVVPRAIAEGLQLLVPQLPAGNIARAKGVFDIDAPLAQVEHRVPWADDATKAAAMAFEEELLAIGDANEEEAPLLNRAFETAVRLATIHAVSRSGVRVRAAVEMADWEWGKAWALTSARNMIRDAGRYMADSDAQAIARAVKRVLVDKGRVTRSVLVKALDHRYKARDLDETLNSMADAGEVKIEQAASRSGPRTKWYSWIG
jgi:hypothetical protein